MTGKDHQPQVTFEALGVHALLCQALADKHILHPNDLQKRTLQHTVRDFADIIVEAPEAHSGRHTLLSVLAAHCCLSVGSIARANAGGGGTHNDGDDDDEGSSPPPPPPQPTPKQSGGGSFVNVPPKVVVVTSGKHPSSISKLHQSLAVLSPISRVVAVQCTDDQPPKQVAHPTSGSGPLNGIVYLGSLATLLRWPADAFSDVVTLLVEDCHSLDSEQLKQLIEVVIQVSTSSNLGLFSTTPPSNIIPSIRYLLRRKNRRYYYHQPSQPQYSYLMCHDGDDRSKLCLTLSTLPRFKSILVLTHNRDVRDLKALLHAELGVKTFSIQRNTTPQDLDRILNDFLRSPYAVLVAMDAYTGVDLMDVDAVIQFYPPQKSMPEEEWTKFVSYMQTTNNPSSPTVVTTLVAPDDFALISYFQKRVGHEGPVINVSPKHPQFAAAVLNPNAVVVEKQRLEGRGGGGGNSSGGVSPTVPAPPATAHSGGSGGGSGGAAAGGGSGNAHHHQQSNNNNANNDKHSGYNNGTHGGHGGGGGAATSSNVPLPRSRRDGEASGGDTTQQQGGSGGGQHNSGNNLKNRPGSGNNNKSGGGGGAGGGSKHQSGRKHD